MPGVRRVSDIAIIIATTAPARFRAALTLALTQAALGGRVRVYVHEDAVPMLARHPRADDESDRLAENGLPDRLDLIAIALEADVEIAACQTGMAIARLDIDDLVPGVEAGGMMALMSSLGSDRLVTF